MSPQIPDGDIDEIVSAVSASKKYRTVCPDTVRRIAQREMTQRDGTKAAVKATKRRLHQVYGAFESGFDNEAAIERIEVAYRSGSQEAIRAACRDVLARHTSTRERLPLLDDFYAAIWAVTGPPASVLDVGCGLNPLSLPWMGLAPGAGYLALDIDCERVAFLNRYLALTEIDPLPPGGTPARCQDALSTPPEEEVDVALLLKMSPTLERQESGATLHLVEQLRARQVVVSYAVQSLGGREKGMADHYEAQFSAWAADRSWPVDKILFDTELVFVVSRGG